MYKVILADDEFLIRKNLKKILGVYDERLEVVAEAIDGQQALEMICEHEADIVFTDIKMPKMSGLELVKEIKRRRPDIFLVIVSGYDEFNFVREALHYQVEDYILKPISKQQIEDVIAKILHKIEARPQTYIAPAQRFLEFRDLADLLSDALWMNDEQKAKQLLEEIWDNQFGRLERESMCKPYAHLLLSLIVENIAQKITLNHLTEESVMAIYHEDTKSFMYSMLSALYQEIKLNKNWSSHYKIRAALKYIDHHFQNEDLNLEAVAEQIGMLSSSFSQAFKEEMQQSYIQYVIGLRIDKAKMLLKNTSINAYEIASRVGYANYSHFNKAFKKKCGYSPTEYRKRYHSDEVHGGKCI